MSRRPAPLDPVALVDRWDGFCLPCGSGARPLALTWTGQRGLRAWLAGAGWGDGVLRLTCACCGGVDVVGWEDEPEPVTVEQPVRVEQPVGVEQPETDEQPVRVEQPVTEVPAAAPAPVVRVVRVLDLDAPSADAVHAVAQVPAPRRPSRAERRAAARRTPAPRGAADADALDLLHLAG